MLREFVATSRRFKSETTKPVFHAVSLQTDMWPSMLVISRRTRASPSSPPPDPRLIGQQRDANGLEGHVHAQVKQVLLCAIRRRLSQPFFFGGGRKGGVKEVADGLDFEHRLGGRVCAYVLP